MKQIEIKKQRDKSIDSISGFFICYMIYTHLCQKTGLETSLHYVILDCVFYFFMPWFFYKSGVFYKNEKNSTIEIKKISKRFIVPFVVFGIANLPIFCLTTSQIQNGDPFWLNYIKMFVMTIVVEAAPFGNTPLWFLYSIIMIRLFVAEIRNDKLYLPISVICTFACFLLWKYQIAPLRLFVCPFLGFVFFNLGYILKQFQYNKYYFITSMLAFMAIAIFCPSHISIRSNEAYGGGYFLALFSSLCGIVTINNLMRLAVLQPKIYSSRLLGIFCRIGEDSMYYFVIHMIYLDILLLILDYYNLNAFLVFVLLPLALAVSKRAHLLENYTK